MPSNFIEVKGARVNNLKNISLLIPRDQFIVITCVSGSGKSSLAFDTLYAGGQRRYVESLSSYARQFLGRINKPDVDMITGLPPAIALEQKVISRNPRSTVGTSTEIYDYLKLLYARIGITYSPVSGKRVTKHTINDVINFIFSNSTDQKIILLAPLHLPEKLTCKQYLELLQQQGFTMLEIKGGIQRINKIEDYEKLKDCEDSFLVVDRFIATPDDDNKSRIADSIQTAFFEGKGSCYLRILDSNYRLIHFSNKFELDGIEFEEPSVYMFSFNNPVGACQTCEGFGSVIGIDEDLVIPNKSLSVYEDAVACWKGEKMQEWKFELVNTAKKFDFPIHRPYYELSNEQKKLIWNGNEYFGGIWAFFRFIEENAYKIQYRVLLSRYRGKTICPECNGTRLKREAGYVKVGGKSIHDLVLMPVEKLNEFFKDIRLTDYEREISNRIMTEIKSRLQYLCDVGLGYLTLNRLSSTLSGGESQRINLATTLGSSLVGSMYILDEPSIGLHTRDTKRLISVLRNLQEIGNTIIVVEHDEEIIHHADQIIDIGPLAGINGGEVVFQGNVKKLKLSYNSLTHQYLSQQKKIAVPLSRRKWNNFIEIKGALENNLKHINVKFPLNVLSVITGVSGSGKSSLMREVFYAALKRHFGGTTPSIGHFDELSGDIHLVADIEFVDQNPIGRSSRSNPATYIKVYDEIRKLYADQQASKINSFKPSHFSFNVEGGRCEECQGEGVIKVEMQFMADIELVCDSCKGRKFKDDVLEVEYKGKNIYDILNLTVNEAIEFFSKQKGSTEKRIVEKLKPLVNVGLGYIKLGQSSSTLSGGESQRIKLASYLGIENNSKQTVFVFDEPTTGLHFEDVKVLLKALNALLIKGHTVIIIEHNLDVIKCADWLIDLGPEGGEEGGFLVFEGTPEQIIHEKKSYTGKFLQDKLKKEMA